MLSVERNVGTACALSGDRVPDGNAIIRRFNISRYEENDIAPQPMMELLSSEAMETHAWFFG